MLSNSRILAIYPNARGFGFAVMEGRDNLVDWGMMYVPGGNRDQAFRKVRLMLDRYRPDHLVTLHPQKSPQRGLRVRRLLAGILDLAKEQDVPRTGLSRDQVRRVFSEFDETTKQVIAQTIASRFPELQHRLPPKRKPWMSEDSRMAIFDAVALALSLQEYNV